MKLKYKPYTGGAGPDDKQIAHNNLVLMQELNRLNIPYEYKDISKRLNIEYRFMAVVVFKNVEISYDRWGYSSGRDEIDQTDLKDTLKYIKKRYEQSKIK